MQKSEAPDVKTVAAWMTRELAYFGELYPPYVADDVQKQFGDRFVRQTPSGNLAVTDEVREAFKAMNPTMVYERYWWRLKE